MTGEEKRRQLKEQYKQELRTRKEFLEKAKKLRKMQRINEALSEINKAMDDDTDEWIRKLNEEAALTEAKMEMFIDQATPSLEHDKMEDLAVEAERARLSAEEMVKQLKREMGLLKNETKPSTTDQASQQKSSLKKSVEQENKDHPASDEDQLPPQKKTLGDF